MNKPIFDKHLSSDIIMKSTIDPYGSVKDFEDYFIDYPNDFLLKSYYILLLIRIYRGKEALSEYNKLLEKLKDKENRNVIKTFNNEKFMSNMRAIRVKLLILLKKYDELEKYFEDNYALFDIDAQNVVPCFLKVMRGERIDLTDSRSYRLHQMVNYKEEEFIKHVQRHVSSEHIKYGNAGEVMFWEDFPLEEILEEIKKYIPSNKRQFLGLVDDTYFFKYDSCGYDNGTTTDFFKVVLFRGTDIFITMYPSLGCENYKYVDLNYVPRKQCGISAGTSQVDKFYKRLAKKGLK